MINIITGKPGMGKTYTLVRIALKSIKQGRNVYSNFHIDLNKFYPKYPKQTVKWGTIYFWKNVEDLMTIRSGDILMDEAQIYLNSRKWQLLPPELMYKLQQHRKQGLNIYGAVQNLKRIDTVCRELVNSVFVVKRIHNIFIMNEYDVEDIDKVKRDSYSFKLFFLSKRLASCYDTLQEIDYYKKQNSNFEKVSF